MALALKLLAVATPIVGGGIGVPVYFLTTSNKVVISQNLKEFLSEVSSSKWKKSEEFKKVSCTSSDIADNSDSVRFLKEQKQNEALYSYVSCYGTSEQREDISLLGTVWEGWFPKRALKKTFSPSGTDGRFDINVQTIQGKGGLNDVVTTFSNSEKSSFIRARWVDALDKNHFATYKKEIVASIEDGEQELRDVYLSIYLPSTTTNFPSR